VQKQWAAMSLYWSDAKFKTIYIEHDSTETQTTIKTTSDGDGTRDRLAGDGGRGQSGSGQHMLR